MLDLAVIGGGVAGLTALRRAQNHARAAGYELKSRLFEGEARLGGKVRTERDGGFLVEAGPDAFTPKKPQVLELLRELGLEDELLASRDEERRLDVLVGGRLVPLLEGLRGLVPTRLGSFLASPLLSPWGKLRLLAEPLVPARRGEGEESLADFARRRLGREGYERLAEPLLAHVYAADAERLSAAAAYPGLVELERRFGSLRRGVRKTRGQGGEGPRFWTLEGGLGRLVEALDGDLDLGTVELGRRVVELQPPAGPEGPYGIVLEDGSRFQARGVILAVPSWATAELVGDWAGELASELKAMRWVSLATVSLGYRRRDVGHPLDAFGFLVPRGEGRTILGATWVSSKFEGRAPEEHVLVRVFLGGALHPSLFGQGDAEIIERAENEIAPLLGLRGESVHTRLFRWPRGYPQYDLGHGERVERIETLCPAGLELAGSSYHGIGLADVVESGHQAGGRAIEKLLERAQ